VKQRGVTSEARQGVASKAGQAPGVYRCPLLLQLDIQAIQHFLLRLTNIILTSTSRLTKDSCDVMMLLDVHLTANAYSCLSAGCCLLVSFKPRLLEPVNKDPTSLAFLRSEGRMRSFGTDLVTPVVNRPCLAGGVYVRQPG
jgi:hypothetical protein